MLANRQSLLFKNSLYKNLRIFTERKSFLKRPTTITVLDVTNGRLFNVRYFCTSKTNPDNNKKDASNKSDSPKEDNFALADIDDYEEYEEPKTAGQKVMRYGAIFGQLILIFGGLVCIGFTIRELFPIGRMVPNNIFNEAFEIIRDNDEVALIVGDSVKAFGRDVGRNTEGRRNIIEERSYTESDGSKRVRVRFHVQGTKGKVTVYAEVSNKMANNEFVYLICQDASRGRVITIQDNRARLAMESTMSSNEGKDAMSALLGSIAGTNTGGNANKK